MMQWILRRIWKPIMRMGHYTIDRYSLTFFYLCMWILIVLLQMMGGERIDSEIFNGIIKGYLGEFRWILFFFIVAIGNCWLFKNYFIYVIKQQSAFVKIMDNFLAMTIEENQLSWFYIIKLVLTILGRKSSLEVWVTPQQYMKMHTAAAILSRQYHYSFYRAPANIWEILRNHGGTEYVTEVVNTHLQYGRRYVVRDPKCTNNYAYNDFQGIANLRLYYVSAEKTSEIPDFSSFDVGDNFISLRISDCDREYVKSSFDKPFCVSTPEDSLKELNKIKFKVHIGISDRRNIEGYDIPSTDWVQNALSKLDSVRRQSKNK